MSCSLESISDAINKVGYTMESIKPLAINQASLGVGERSEVKCGAVRAKKVKPI